jgi:DHA2 family multidrug resistance protein-like MFS transporter
VAALNPLPSHPPIRFATPSAYSRCRRSPEEKPLSVPTSIPGPTPTGGVADAARAEPRPAGEGPDGLPMPRRAWAIVAVSFGTALVVLDGAIATVALPTIARDLHTDGSAAVLIVTVYQLVLVMSLLPLSAVGDRIGLKRLYQGGQMVFTVATALCFFAHSLPFLLVVRALQGFGAAAALSVSPALVRSIYPAKQLGRGLGINGVVVSSSAALAPALGGFVLGIAPWPWVFACAVPFAVLSLLLGRAVPDVAPVKSPYDLPGAAMSAATFGLVIAGLESWVHGGSPPVAAAGIAAGVVIGAVFVRRELGQVRPILPVDLLARPVLALSSAGALTAFTASSAAIIGLPFRLESTYGFAPGAIGAMIVPWPLTVMVVAPTAGWLSDRVPAGLLGGIGMAVSVAGLVTLAFLPAHPGYWDIAWRMALAGSGFGLFLSPNARLILGSAPRDRTASMGGLIATTRLTGQTLGATLAATLLAHGLAVGKASPLIAAGLAAVAGACSLARLRPGIRNTAGVAAPRG